MPSEIILTTPSLRSNSNTLIKRGRGGTQNRKANFTGQLTNLTCSFSFFLSRQRLNIDIVIFLNCGATGYQLLLATKLTLQVKHTNLRQNTGRHWFDAHLRFD